MYIELPYAPRKQQREIHNSLKRFSVIVCHRRFGKTVMAINHLIRRALTCDLSNPRYAYVAPSYKQAKRVAWDYIKLYTAPIPGVSYNESELRCDFPNGARIQLLGAESPDSLRGMYLDGVVLDEVAQMPPSIWAEIIRPALSDRRGWALFIGTPKGQNMFYDLYQTGLAEDDWYSVTFRASDTGIIDQEELEAARRIMSEEEFSQEFECSFTAAIVGAYYGKEMARLEADGRITTVPHDPAHPVFTTWDLGLDDNLSVWCGQEIGYEIRWIEHVTVIGGVPEMMRELKSRPYNYGNCYLPHDAQPRQIGSGVSIKETIKSLGFRDIVIAEMMDVEDGINAVRLLLPKSCFDRTKCKDGVLALQNYQREWSEKMGTFRPKPRHDWASHPADALRTFATARRPKTHSLDYKTLYG